MKNTKKESKKTIYARYGIEYESGKIHAPIFGWIKPLLIDGNAKLGKGVWTFSLLPGTGFYKAMINGSPVETKGTCCCDCVGCYAKTGFFNMPSVINSLVIKTALCRMCLDFVKRAIMAQIEADNIKLCRIHAAGEFFSAEYIELWQEVAKAFPACLFWSYTKNPEAKNMFNGFDNANIVPSIVAGFGYNFGKCGYIIDMYKALKEAGNKVYICRCGIDKNQHCNNCKGCPENEYVLFLEHSTAYKAENDPRYEELKALIEAQ